MNILQSIYSTFLDFIYPPVCIVCNTLLSDGTRKICNACWNSMPKITRDTPLYQETKLKLMKDAYINDLVSCFVFEKDGTFQHIAHALKYQEYKSVGILLGYTVGQKILEWHIEADCIIPIPLHPVKQRERGFNQSELIACGISSIIHKPVASNIIRRLRNTQSQTKLNSEERLKNMTGAFEVVPGHTYVLNSRTCILVDDVITTGATTHACAAELARAGASKIIAASSALAQ